ncbi:MAG: hydrogenase expression/formation protein HupK [Pseudomonadota bacterium]|nr:hydrogenase expression/formation protein HupK [Pseudomonadota bacterium]
MLDTGANWQVTTAPAMPLEALVIGRPAEDVADLLPRLFNLCRAAQSRAVRLALDLPVDPADLKQEIVRDHLMKLCVTWPRLLGRAPMPLPLGWQEGGEGLLFSLFAMPFPDTPEDFREALILQGGIAGTLIDLARAIPEGTGAFARLPAIDDITAFTVTAAENSVAGRQAHHPVLRRIEAKRGRDLFWRAVARVYDIADAVRGTLPAPRLAAPGRALVPAARGTYAVSATVSGGKVTQFARITPTDHLLAPGGVLASTLAALSDGQTHLAPLALDILDPCQPVDVKEAQHA